LSALSISSVLIPPSYSAALVSRLFAC
jgi:hypothetical protein